MNNNTRLRVRVPKALYESIQAQLAKKQIKEETTPVQAGAASSKEDDQLMASLAPAKKLVNSKITTPQEFAKFLKTFASDILNNENFADSLTKNANYSNAIKYLTQLSGDEKK